MCDGLTSLRVDTDRCLFDAADSSSTVDEFEYLSEGSKSVRDASSFDAIEEDPLADSYALSSSVDDVERERRKDDVRFRMDGLASDELSDDTSSSDA